MLNRQQHMLLQLREQREKFMESQNTKQLAQIAVNESLRQQDHHMSIEAVQSARSVRSHSSNENKGYQSRHSDRSVPEDIMSNSGRPKSAAEQILTEGRVSQTSSRRSSIKEEEKKDIFGNSESESSEKDGNMSNRSNDKTLTFRDQDKIMHSINDEMQRLRTSASSDHEF